MISKLRKWLCLKCGWEWFSLKTDIYFKCLKCGALCIPTKNEWKINEI